MTTKIRIDIFFLMIILMIIFIPLYSIINLDDNLYEKTKMDRTLIGYQANDKTPIAYNLTDIEKYKSSFALQIKTDNLKKTKLYKVHGRLSYGNSYISPRINDFFDNESYDRYYIATLEDGNKIIICFDDRIIDLSGKNVLLPISDYEKYNYHPILSELTEKYNLDDSASKHLINASGGNWRSSVEATKLSQRKHDIIWGIITFIVAAYSIVSTVYIMKANKNSKKDGTKTII